MAGLPSTPTIVRIGNSCTVPINNNQWSFIDPPEWGSTQWQKRIMCIMCNDLCSWFSSVGFMWCHAMDILLYMWSGEEGVQQWDMACNNHVDSERVTLYCCMWLVGLDHEGPRSSFNCRCLCRSPLSAHNCSSSIPEHYNNIVSSFPRPQRRRN